MGKLVVPQVILSPERFTTYITREWALIRVCSLVDQQVVALGELTVTELAYVSLLWSLVRGLGEGRGEESVS